jgi:hypothetical protein
VAVQNSPIQAKGIGKTAKRHDLSGTPGLSNSDLQYGDVQRLEQAQRSVQSTQGRPVQQGGAQPQGHLQKPGMEVPDPVDFAIKKVGGGPPAVPTEPLEQIDMQPWLPLMRQIATAGSSSLLMSAYVNSLQKAQKQPYQSGGVALINMAEYDNAIDKAF